MRNKIEFDMITESTNNHIPQLRFPEFQNDGEWEVKRLGEIADFYKGKGISKTEASGKGKTPCVRYGELYTHYKEVITETQSFTDIPTEELFLSKVNDVIIPSSGETKEDISTASCVLKDNIALGGDINVIRGSIDGVFLSYYLNNVKKNDIAKIAQGVSIIHLYNEQLKSLQIALPSLNEQRKIASCLIALAEMITATTNKLEQLKAYKKGLMQKLFSTKGKTLPEYRFKEFEKDGEWKVKKLGELIVVNSGKDYKHLNHGNIPVFGTGGYMLSVDDKLSDVDAVGIGRKGTIDKPQYLKAPFWTVDTLFFLTEIGGDDIRFIYYLSQTIPWKKYGEQTGVPSLSKVSIENLEVIVPSSTVEQNKIVQTLLSLDEEIDSLSKKRESIENYKNGLIQQLFTK